MNSEILVDKCTFCAGGPEEDHSPVELEKYGRNRLAEGKLANLCGNVFQQSVNGR